MLFASSPVAVRGAPLSSWNLRRGPTPGWGLSLRSYYRRVTVESDVDHVPEHHADSDASANLRSDEGGEGQRAEVHGEASLGRLEGGMWFVRGTGVSNVACEG